jgi:hypothetical protein
MYARKGSNVAFKGVHQKAFTKRVSPRILAKRILLHEAIDFTLVEVSHGISRVGVFGNGGSGY